MKLPIDPERRKKLLKAAVLMLQLPPKKRMEILIKEMNRRGLTSRHQTAPN